MVHIACFGDSLVQGFPYGNDYSWVATSEKLLGAKVKLYNYGLCGDCCDDILYRMRSYPLPKEVTHIIFLGGANDVLQGCSREYTLNVFPKLLDFCREHEYKLAIILPLISGDEYYNRALLNLKQDLEHRYKDKIELFDVQSVIGTTREERLKAYIDGFHPRVTVYEALGSYLADKLENWINK